MTTTLGGYTGLPCEKSFEPWGVRQLAPWKETRAQIPNRESQTLLVCPHLKLRTQEFCSVGGMASDALTLHFCKPIYPFTSQVSLVIKSPAYSTERPPGAWWALGRNMGDNGWSLRVQSHSPTTKKMRLVLLFIRRKWVFSELCVSVSTERLPRLRDEREQIAVTQLGSSQKHCQPTSVCFTEAEIGGRMESAERRLHFES